MVYNGANNATKDSIHYALRLSGLSLDDLNNTCKALLQQMPSADNQVNISIANSIWYDKAILPVPNFLTTNKQFYNAGITPLDFNNPSAVSTINNWVAANTQQKITKIIDAIPSGILMYLVNAIYFKGTWHYKFDANATANAPFYTANGSTVPAPFMYVKNGFDYYGNDTVQMVQLPYGGGNFNMYALLPNSNSSALQLAAKLNAGTFHNWQAHLDSTTLQLYLPKFKYSYSIDDMRPELAGMGMDIAFRDVADFSKMYTVPTHISQAIHKTFIEVNEDGTTAAAVTAIGAGTTSILLPPTMRFNHPFLYLIQEKTSGVILFMGIINNPTQ
jgi:serpin B